jgi:hypothetical protein
VRILTQDDEEDIVRIGEGEIGKGLRNGAKTSVASGSATLVDEGQIKMEGTRQTQTRLSLATTSAATRSPVQMGTMYGTTASNAGADAREAVTASLVFGPDGECPTISIPNLQMAESSEATLALPLDAEPDAHQGVTAGSLEFGIDSVTASMELDFLTVPSTPGVSPRLQPSLLPSPQENGLMLDSLQEDWPVLALQEEGLMLDCNVLDASPQMLAATQKRRSSLQASEMADMVRVPALQER